MIVGDYYSGNTTTDIIDYIIVNIRLINDNPKTGNVKTLVKINSVLHDINNWVLKILAEVPKPFRIDLRIAKWFGYWIRAGPFYLE